MYNGRKKILQEEANKIDDILQKEDLSDDKRQYLKDLKKYMLDKKRGFRKPVKSAEKEQILKSACDKLLERRMKKGGVYHNNNNSLVGNRKVVVNKEDENKKKEEERRRRLMAIKTLKHQKLYSIPEGQEGGKRKTRKTRKNKKNKRNTRKNKH